MSDPSPLLTLCARLVNPTWSVLWLTLGLASCANTSRAPTSQTETARPQTAAEAAPDPGLNKDAQAFPVSSRPELKARALAGNPAPDSYTYRPDAQALADELARQQNLDPIWTWEMIAKARFIEAATKLMMPPPVQTAKNWSVYRSRFIEPQRIKAGVSFWRTYAQDLKRAEIEYGVPSAVIAGVLGVETIYGRDTGNFRVLDVLTTLSLDFPKGRSDRSAFFKDELGEFLKLCQEQDVAPDSVMGSYAGAIGLPQFMPSSIRKYAVDFDGDGRIDLQRSPVDAIGSIAHYLAEHGWQSPWPAYYDIKPPKETAALSKLLAPDIVPSFSAQQMQDLGAVLPPAAREHPGQLALVQLFNGPAAPTMIAGTVNFYAITRYNQSSYYALAVVQLGDVVSREATRAINQNR